MISPILATKFYIPRLRPDWAPRPRLCRKLTEGLANPLVLISSPAGFGKTTLLTEWCASPTRQAAFVAWVALEPEDSDPLRFVACLGLALEPLLPGIGTELQIGGQLNDPPRLQDRLSWLLAYCTRLAQPCVFVLDDYHLINNKVIHEGMAYLIDHLPPSMHLVLSSRVDPPLPLARYRVRGDLTEIRTDDLRFTRAEIETYLNQMKGLMLSSAQIETLEFRTEGWIAGLKLAALSLLSDPQVDAATFVAEFAGSHRYIADYLMEEVLNGQSAAVRHFLLQTSVLSVLSGPLCNAVTGQRDGQAMLEQLEHENLFIVRLDEDRSWFRYHHLFAELLRNRLNQLDPALASQVIRRAVAWYEQHAMWDCAVHEAVKSGDYELAADVLERCYPAIIASNQRTTLVYWLRALPSRILYKRQRLAELAPTLFESRLTPRELEVIRLVGVGASNRQIAQALIVSLGTVKKHVNNIFLKLGAQSRTQAVARARELGLL